MSTVSGLTANKRQVAILVNEDGSVVTTGGGGGGGGGDASAANQTTQITAANLTNSRIGAVDEAAAAADGTGDYSLIAAAKRSLLNWAPLLARLPTLGAKAGSGSVSTVPATDARYVGAPFAPAAVVTHACSTTALASQACTPGQQIRILARNNATIYFAFGSSTINSTIAAASAMTVSGSPEPFTVPPGVTHYSAVMASGTGTLEVTTGVGA